MEGHKQRKRSCKNPFGEVSHVKNWLQIYGKVGRPINEHPRRIIQGLECKRTEVSGRRFWELIKDISGTPEKFFTSCFVYNYCPLTFLSHTGKNITPPQLKADTRNALNEICGKALIKIINLLNVEIIIGVGKYAEKQAKITLKGMSGIFIGNIMHPSPINPATNNGSWKSIAKKQLQELRVLHYFLSSD